MTYRDIGPGEILAVRQGLYWHVGIHDGAGHVLSRRPGKGVVRETFDEFAADGTPHLVPIDRPSFPPAVAESRAKSTSRKARARSPMTCSPGARVRRAQPMRRRGRPPMPSRRLVNWRDDWKFRAKTPIPG